MCLIPLYEYKDITKNTFLTAKAKLIHRLRCVLFKPQQTQKWVVNIYISFVTKIMISMLWQCVYQWLTGKIIAELALLCVGMEQ